MTYRVMQRLNRKVPSESLKKSCTSAASEHFLQVETSKSLEILLWNHDCFQAPSLEWWKYHRHVPLWFLAMSTQRCISRSAIDKEPRVLVASIGTTWKITTRTSNTKLREWGHRAASTERTALQWRGVVVPSLALFLHTVSPYESLS